MRALACSGLVKRYGDLVAVDGLDLEVDEGECFGLLGPNGAGKTTTIEIFEGLMSPDDGRVQVLGCHWGTGRRDNELRQRLGIHLQETQLDERLSVRETLDLFRSFYRRGHTVDSVLATLGLGTRAATWVGKLSGGQKQRLAVGCALVGDPDLLFLDEPTTGLDPQSRRQLWDVLHRFREAGNSILLTTHYMDEAQVLCDRVAIVDHGRIIAAGTPRELIESLGAAHVIEFELEHGPDGRVGDDLGDDRGVVQADDERADDQHIDDAGLTKRLHMLPSVEAVRRDASVWQLTAASLQDTLPALLRVAEDEQLGLRQLTSHTATLEDVFVSLTGRHLRDE